MIAHRHRSSDGEDEEYLGDAVGPGVGSLSKARAKSADWKKMTTNTGGPHMGDLTLIKASQGNQCSRPGWPCRVSNTIYRPLLILGHSKEERLFSLGPLKEATYQAMVQWP